ncbi:MAG: nucleoside diphosphate kinase [Candidatus Promineifilaceae bacterium]|jgi:nucleoside diphosphate kinase
MAKELAFVILNPYTLSKSRTGGVIARYLARTQLDLVAARMFGPSQELIDRHAEIMASSNAYSDQTRDLLVDYVRKNLSPDAETDVTKRVMFLLFEGEDAIQRVWDATGPVELDAQKSGLRVRDTYGDYIQDADGKVTYFEPAVLVASTEERSRRVLQLWAEYSESCGGIMDGAVSADAANDQQEKTLVMLKPDNFTVPSLRPGSIVDMLSRSGLTIIGAKLFRMTVSQAEAFYGPVKEVLLDKFEVIGGGRLAEAIKTEFGFEVDADVLHELCGKLAPVFASTEFENITEYMTGYRPSAYSEEEKDVLGDRKALALVYRGPDAVSKIRHILGATDPAKAEPGSIRAEFGTNIRENAAHASDSPENAEREIGIIRVAEDTIAPWVAKYCD